LQSGWGCVLAQSGVTRDREEKLLDSKRFVRKKEDSQCQGLNLRRDQNGNTIIIGSECGRNEGRGGKMVRTTRRKRTAFARQSRERLAGAQERFHRVLKLSARKEFSGPLVSVYK